MSCHGEWDIFWASDTSQWTGSYLVAFLNLGGSEVNSENNLSATSSNVNFQKNTTPSLEIPIL